MLPSLHHRLIFAACFHIKFFNNKIFTCIDINFLLKLFKLNLECPYMNYSDTVLRERERERVRDSHFAPPESTQAVVVYLPSLQPRPNRHYSLPASQVPARQFVVWSVLCQVVGVLGAA